MELRQLEYFAEVAELLNFGRAAERLHVGQPAVSQQIQRLERELGQPLFDRSARTVRLTEAGQRLLPEARAVLAAVERARAAAQGGPASGPLRLGTSTGLGERLSRCWRRCGGWPRACPSSWSTPRRGPAWSGCAPGSWTRHSSVARARSPVWT
ncbi:MAG TPA: LysR family transcriptional regulator [Jatrophihabitantaceae bacterium]